jgi:hypothetical protein
MHEGKVNFFFVGYPKCGSTTFYDLLRTHPEFFAPNLKEPKYFSSDIYREMKGHLGDNYYQILQSESEYASLFEGAGDKIRGDFNPFNIFSREAPRNIYDYNSHAKILICVREPVSFLRSFHFQSLYGMTENEPDFLRALSLETSRKNGLNIPQYCQVPSYLYYSQLIEYKTHIKRYIDVFGFKNVKIILFDDVIKNEYGVYRDILRFLNAKDINFTPSLPDRNSSHTIRFARLRKLILNPRIRKWLYTHIPLRLLPVGAKISQKVFKKNQDKPFVSPEDIKQLREKYKINVDDLNNFLQENGVLSHDLCKLWDY